MWYSFFCGRDNLLGGQFWAMGRLNLLGGKKTHPANLLFASLYHIVIKDMRATRSLEFPQTETGPGSGNILKNIVGSVGEFNFGSVRFGVFFLPGYETLPS